MQPLEATPAAIASLCLLDGRAVDPSSYRISLHNDVIRGTALALAYGYAFVIFHIRNGNHDVVHVQLITSSSKRSGKQASPSVMRGKKSLLTFIMRSDSGLLIFIFDLKKRWASVMWSISSRL